MSSKRKLEDGEENLESLPPLKKARVIMSKEDIDESYFDLYSHIDIHETMLKDGVRTNAYR